MSKQINVTEKEYQALVNDYYAGRTNLTMKELFENYNIVLEVPPTHANPAINKLVERFCTKHRYKEGAIIYDGSARNYLGFDRYLSDDFVPMWKAFNGYREVYFSANNLCEVTTVEGDVTIVLFNSPEDYEKGYADAEKFYEEN